MSPKPERAGAMDWALVPKATIDAVAMKKCIKRTQLRKGSGNSYPYFFLFVLPHLL